MPHADRALLGPSSRGSGARSSLWRGVQTIIVDSDAGEAAADAGISPDAALDVRLQSTNDSDVAFLQQRTTELDDG